MEDQHNPARIRPHSGRRAQTGFAADASAAARKPSARRARPAS